jgi:hypothetical protein
LVGHGIMLGLIAKHLRSHGWRGPRYPARGYWETTVYRNEVR